MTDRSLDRRPPGARPGPAAKVLSALFVASLFPASVAGQATASLPPDSARTLCRLAHGGLLDEIRFVHHKQKNVGLSAAVAVHGTVAFSEQLGFADLEHRVPVGPATRFGIASVTKAYTGVALLKLHEAGAVALDEPVQVHVPEFPEKPGGAITPHLLAIHRAGIRHYRPGERTPAFYAAHYDSAVEILELFAEDSLLAEPGAAYSYSSYGYNLLAAVVERAAGRPFPDVVQTDVIDALGLEATRFDDARYPLSRRSERYSYYHPTDYRVSDSVWLVPRWDYSYNMGGGNLVSTAEDLARFGQAFVEPGFLTEESLERVHERQGPEGGEGAWSYGWIVREDAAGRKLLRINGSNAGLQAALVVYPEHHLSVAVLSNTWGLGSRSAEMVVDLPARMAERCLPGSAEPTRR